MTADATIALVALVALVSFNGALDWCGFGLLTGMRYGSPRQAMPWDELPGWLRVGYRAFQYAVLIVSTYWVATLGRAASVGAAASLVAYAGMMHDLAFHVVGGHLRRGSGWRPFSYAEKCKPWSVHFWPLRAWHIATGGAYERGVPYRWETWGRLAFGALAVVYVLVSVYEFSSDPLWACRWMLARAPLSL